VAHQMTVDFYGRYEPYRAACRSAQPVDVDMSRWNMPSIKVETVYTARDGVHSMRVVCQVKDVCNTDGRMTQIEGSFPIRRGEDVGYQVKQWLMRAIEHEIDECLYVNGERVCQEVHP
jgi:hypothetical protein